MVLTLLLIYGLNIALHDFGSQIPELKERFEANDS